MASSSGKLDALQVRVLDALAGLRPPFVLSGGAALAGVYLQHRTTRDLDLFWRNRERLDDVPSSVRQRLTDAGLSVETLQTGPAFVQLQVSDGALTVVVDLIAEPTADLAEAQRHTIGDKEVLVDSPRAILAEKLCALLERAELRDLMDVEALVNRGERLAVAIAEAPRRDSGFSPLTLAWVLRDFNVAYLAAATGINPEAAARLDAFRLMLIEELTAPAPC